MKMIMQPLIRFNEPDLEFRFGQRVKDPRDGLALFGPYGADLSGQPRAINYIVIGTPDGISKFRNFSALINYPALAAPNNNYRLWPPFPGFEAAFASVWPEQPVRSFTIDSHALTKAARFRDPHERAFEVVKLYLETLYTAAKLDEPIGVAICVVPDDVWLNCRPKSRVSNPSGERLSSNEREMRRAGQLDLFDTYDPTQYHLSPDFRRQLKARAMEFNIPLQLVRESTLRPTSDNPFGQRALTPLSDRLWNICTTLFYKCGGKPWRLVTARDGVCYIGLAFRRTDDHKTACCAAQMFLNTGDGVVFLGEYGPWYSPETRQFHLTRASAKSLLEGVLSTYKQLGGKPLTEIFLHSRSGMDADEYTGFQEASPAEVKLTGIRIRADRDNPRLYRIGKMPVLRGTFWKINERSGFLWGSGFQPRQGTYSGWEVPVPLRLDIQHGDAVIERVAQDVMGLTKLNYNACRIGDTQPVTIGFSDAVGEILISNPTIEYRRPQFKFYI